MIQAQVRELKQKALWSFSVRFPPPLHIWSEIQKSLGKGATHCLIPSFATRTSSHPDGPFPGRWIPADKLANIPRVRRVKQSPSAFFIDIWTTPKCLSLKWPGILFKPHTCYPGVQSDPVATSPLLSSKQEEVATLRSLYKPTQQPSLASFTQ